MARYLLLLLPLLLMVVLMVVQCEGYEVVAGSDLADEKTQIYGGRHGNLRQSDCPSACSNRCSQTSKRKACMFFCNKCCAKCLCVPPGTYGNKEVCPCYNDWKTQSGGPKCP